MLKIGNRDERGRDTGFFTSDKAANIPAPPPINETKGEGESVIGEHISIEGAIRANEDLVIQGAMKGTIEVRSHRLTVGPKGKVEADVEADNVTISGRMVGTINATGKVVIGKEADFCGQIKAKRIAIEDGAYMKATIELEKEGVKQQPPTPSVKRPVDAFVSEEKPALKPEPVKAAFAKP